MCEIGESTAFMAVGFSQDDLGLLQLVDFRRRQFQFDEVKVGLPAYLLPDFTGYDRLIREVGIFDDRVFFRDVVRPVLHALGIDGDELRDARRRLRVV